VSWRKGWGICSRQSQLAKKGWSQWAICLWLQPLLHKFSSFQCFQTVYLETINTSGLYEFFPSLLTKVLPGDLTRCGLIIEKQKQCQVCVCILWLIAINICVLWHFVLCKCVLTWLFKDCTARCCATEVRAICCVLCLSSGHVHGGHLKTVLIMQSSQLIRSEAATVKRPQVIVKGRCGKYGKVNVSLESERVAVIQRVTVMLARLATRKDREFHLIQHCRTQKPTSVVCFWMFYVEEE